MQITDKSVDVFREKLAVFRAGWKELLVREMGEREGGVLAAILLGEKSDMDPEMKELYQVNGIGHILAISGLHLSFAGLGAYRLFRRLTGSYKAGGLAGGMLLFLYVSMIGMTVSVLRAWVMFLFRVGADVTGRKYDMPTALSVAAVIAVGSNPLYLYDGGFLLSFGALLAIWHSDTTGEGRITAAGNGTYIVAGNCHELCVVAGDSVFLFRSAVI